MPFFGGRPALKATCIYALLAALAGSAHALEPGNPEDNGLDLDQAVQSLKDEMVLFNRDAQIAENAFLFPPQTRLSLYLSNRIPELLLEKITVTIDDTSPVVYEYSEIDAHALLDPRALQPLVQINIARGAHRVRADFVGRYAEAKEGAAPVVGRYEGVIDKGVEPAEIELRITRAARRSSPAIKLKEWRVAEE
ncbi:MAG: hypothetical protein ACT4PZ_03600 [Panacagrimonas sp.]